MLNGIVSVVTSAILLASPAASAPAVPDVSACKALAGNLSHIMHVEVSNLPESAVTARPGSCIFSHATLNMSGFFVWSIDRLTIASPDIARGAGTTFPGSLRVDATGIRLETRIADSHARYLTSVAQKPFDVSFQYDRDRAARRLTVREVTIRSPWIGYASLAFDLDIPPDAGAPKGMSKARDVAIRQLHFVLDNREIVESMLIPVLVSLLPADKDPAIEFPKIQKQVELQARELPASSADDASKDALIRFTRDFPHPSGHFEETLRFDHPLVLEELLSGGKGKWLRGAHLQAAYQPRRAGP